METHETWAPGIERGVRRIAGGCGIGKVRDLANKKVIDLRSDTVTRPTAAMREAMATAEVGDDVYGEDPTINQLEAEVAAMFGHAAAVFVPSGTMGNQVSLRLLCGRGEELICDADAHIVSYEAGAAAANGG